jgi:hypothetical protein
LADDHRRQPEYMAGQVLPVADEFHAYVPTCARLLLVAVPVECRWIKEMRIVHWS